MIQGRNGFERDSETEALLTGTLVRRQLYLRTYGRYPIQLCIFININLTKHQNQKRLQVFRYFGNVKAPQTHQRNTSNRQNKTAERYKITLTTQCHSISINPHAPTYRRGTY